MSVFGNILKEKREKMGYSIQDISEITTIQQRYIQALEDDKFETIPGDYYVRSFVKQYATILKLDSQKLIRRYEDYIAENNAKRPEILLQDELRKPARPSETNEVSVVSAPVDSDVDETEIALEEEVIDNEAEAIGDAPIEEIVEFDDVEINDVDMPLVLDSDGLDDDFVEDETYQDVEEFVAPLPVDAIEDDEPTTKMSKKLIALLSVMAIFMVGLIWLIPSVMSNFAPKQTVTTSPSSTLATTASTTAETTTTAQTTTTTTTTTTQTTTVQTTTQETTTAAPQPTNEPADLYIISSDAAQTTYGLGRSFANYTGEYVVTLTASEPVWIRVEIFGQKVHEGTMVPNTPYRFNAYNNAGNMKIRVGLSSALTVTFNGQPLSVPTYRRVQDYTFNFAR